MFTLLGIAAVLATMALAYGAASLIAAVLWRRWARETVTSPEPQSRRLFALRVFPSAVASAAGLFLVLPAYVAFEPRDQPERLGATLAVLALMSACGIFLTGRRMARALLATRRLAERWRQNARRLDAPGLGVEAFEFDHPYPVVSIVGTLRPRIFISRTVLASFTRAELGAAFSHELSHVAAWDNLRRLVVRSLPKAPWSGRLASLESEWEQTMEESADARAPATDPLDLASALVKAARLAPAGQTPEAAAVYLYSGSGLERRVRRLLQPRAVDAPSTARVSWSVCGLLASASLLFAEPALRAVHELVEGLVRLP